jgi:hypothetical protein
VPHVVVRLHGGLEGQSTDSPERRLQLAPGSNLLAVQDALGILRGEVGLFVVDGAMRHEDYTPEDGAVVDIFPLFGGG